MGKNSVLKEIFLAGCVLAGLLTVGCSLQQLKEAKPIIPVQEYERMLLGKLTADYVGNQNCLKLCHVHDDLAMNFKASTMGDQLSESSSGMRIVDCESCHGPGSEAIEEMEGLDAVKDREAIGRICKQNFLDYGALPAGARSMICLKCHTANATFNIHNWNAGPHALNGVSCSDCHPVHGGPDLITAPRAIAEICLSCHLEVSAELSLPSHHPIKEGKILCTDCHESHGTTNPSLLLRMTQKETCGRCHTDKVGPFLFEHADITEECTNCHRSHGAINNNLLKFREPFLCKQCHPQHRVSEPFGSGKAQSFTRCTDCHSRVHGTDTPGASGGGGLTQ
jgi:DmsE family decaheme c-type cytochrome